jgi:hypothetical protein
MKLFSDQFCTKSKFIIRRDRKRGGCVRYHAVSPWFDRSNIGVLPIQGLSIAH